LPTLDRGLNWRGHVVNILGNGTVVDAYQKLVYPSLDAYRAATFVSDAYKTW
jgi:hypothetical protein